jgi:hypothetical protein
MPCLKDKNKRNINPNIHNGIMTKVWGPAGWLFLHCITFGYPYRIDTTKKEDIEKMNKYKEFFTLIGDILPCKYCRESYQDFLKEHPIEPHLNTRKEFTRWFYDIHNKVNHKLGIPECEIPSFESVSQEYELYRAKCKKTTIGEREKNAAKGCIRPANGTPKRCIVKVVSCDNGDITRRTEDIDDVTKYNFPSQTEYLVIHKKHIVFPLLLLILVCICFLYIISKNWKNIKL